MPVPAILTDVEGGHLDDEFDRDHPFLFSRQLRAEDFTHAVAEAKAAARIVETLGRG